MQSARRRAQKGDHHEEDQHRENAGPEDDVRRDVQLWLRRRLTTAVRVWVIVDGPHLFLDEHIFFHTFLFEVWSEGLERLMRVESLRELRLNPLRVQVDGEYYLIAPSESREFYKIPLEGFSILQSVHTNITIEELAKNLEVRFGVSIDVEDFLDDMEALGIVSYLGDHHPIVIKEFPFYYKIPFLFVFAISAGLFIYSMVHNQKFIHKFSEHDVFYFGDHAAIYLAALLLVQVVTVTFHEAAHVMAAKWFGCGAKLSLGNRMWIIVIETDLSEVFSIPRSLRYYPILSGLLSDFVFLTLFSYLFSWSSGSNSIQMVTFWGASGVATAMVMLWQFNVFLRTDIYYVLCNYLGEEDLELKARGLMTSWKDYAINVVLGNPTRELEKMPASVTLFAVIWLLGRIWMVFALFWYVIPTIGLYVDRFANTLSRGKSDLSDVMWAGSAVVLAVGPLFVGLILWIKKSAQAVFYFSERK